MPLNPFFSISIASDIVALLLPGTAARLKAGILVFIIFLERHSGFDNACDRLEALAAI